MLGTGNTMVKLGFCCNNGIRGFSIVLPPPLRFLPLLYSTSTSLVDYGGKVKSSPLSDFLVNSLGFRDNQSVSVSAKLEKLRIMGGTKKNSFGVSIDTIRKSILRSPRALLVRTDLLAGILAEVDELGIPRDSAMFMYGVQLLINHKGKGLENKYAIFKSFGWTQSDIKAFVRRNPFCLTSSESVIKRKLDFLMNHIGYTPDYLVSRISFFTYSVEKRLLPRHRVLQILREKGKTKIALYSVTNLTESAFVQRFVLPFKEVHEVYAQLLGSKRGSLNVGRAKCK